LLKNLLAIRKYLRHNSACSLSEQAKRKDMKGVNDAGSVRDIANWLDIHTKIPLT
jgi:hypothetical protein